MNAPLLQQPTARDLLDAAERESANGTRRRRERLLSDDPSTQRKIEVNLRRNRQQDHTALLDEAGEAFVYRPEQPTFWNPERFSLGYGTPLFAEATQDQRALLNQLFWVAYYSQIISAEVATIYFNQTSAAGLYGLEDMRSVCDMLDLESGQERAHIAAFRKVIDQVEAHWFQERVFGLSFRHPGRGPFEETMIFQDAGPFRRFWKRLQLQTFGLLSSGNAFIASQYFLVRGLRTLNGKIVQHQLAKYFQQFDGLAVDGGRGKPSAEAPLPSQISHFHFCDESYHFNSSTIIGQDVVRSLPAPTAFERKVVNLGVAGCQKDHASFSTLVNGIFWYDPAAFRAVYKVLRSPIFAFDDGQARHMLERMFCEENESMHLAAQTHRTARESYQQYVADLPWLSEENRRMEGMARASVEGVLKRNRKALRGSLSGVRPPRSSSAPFQKGAAR